MAFREATGSNPMHTVYYLSENEEKAEMDQASKENVSEIQIEVTGEDGKMEQVTIRKKGNADEDSSADDEGMSFWQKAYRYFACHNREVESIPYHKRKLDEKNDKFVDLQKQYRLIALQLEKEEEKKIDNRVSDSFLKQFDGIDKLPVKIETSVVDDSDNAKSKVPQIIQDAGNVAVGVGKGAAVVAGGITGQAFKQIRQLGKAGLHGAITVTKTLEYLTIGAAYQKSTTGIVTFNSRVAAASACQMLLTHEPNGMDIKTAPEPSEIIWSNIAVPEPQQESRTQVSDAIFAVGAIFWSALTAGVTALSSLDRLSVYVPGLHQYREQYWYDLISGWLPVLILLGLLNLLPIIFDLVATRYQKKKSLAEVQQVVMSRYFYYQLANVLIAVTAGSLFESIGKIADNPSDILKLLGDSLPTVATYFMDIIIVKILTGLPLELLRVFPLLMMIFYQKCTDRKKRTLRECRSGIYENPQIYYGYVYPELLMVLIICMTYATIAPLISLFGAAYFGLALLVYKYQLLFVYIPKYESGGSFWHPCFRRSLISLLAGQLTLIGFMIVRAGVIEATLLVPLPFITLMFWRYCDDKMFKPTSVLSLFDALKEDRVTCTMNIICFRIWRRPRIMCLHSVPTISFNHR